ncbi:hypothetical protein LMG27952_07647 [Paraburkholderia hiiakae]|uniref:Response regulatory domain-containing protein n=2 Tax=Paraburkholderia hiiakae TaxID=1081782 RepID=A0ABN7IG09_9BURK|nr:hypothetical protein LMG27952_07647 [Paraburkholderia hiiakae]
MNAIAQGRPDVDVPDVRMPNLEGVNLVWLLKGAPARADIPVVPMSAAGRAALPFRAFLSKPFTAARLVEALHAALPPWCLRIGPVKTWLAPQSMP